MKSPVYQQVELPLEKGDVLVFASDGIEELLGQGNEAFSIERLQETLQQLASGSAKEIADGLMRATDQFLGGLEPSDDRTIVALKVTG